MRARKVVRVHATGCGGKKFQRVLEGILEQRLIHICSVVTDDGQMGSCGTSRVRRTHAVILELGFLRGLSCLQACYRGGKGNRRRP